MTQSIPNNVGFVIICESDGNGNPLPVTSSNPIPVTVVDAVATGALQTTQAAISVSGTAVQLFPGSTYVLQNGLVLSAGNSNAAVTSTAGSTGGTWGGSGVNNKTDGTGNGKVVPPGASTGIPSGLALSSIYVNGKAGDVFDCGGD